jgi:hypothetical protein
MGAGLPIQVINLPIDGGLNEARDARALEPPGAWLTVDNWVYEQSGALKKRHGYAYMPSALVGGGDLLEPTRLDTLGRQLLVYGHESVTGLPHLYTWSPAQNAWRQKDDTCPASITRETLQRGPVGAGQAHVSLVDGMLVVTYVQIGYGLMYKVLDAETRASLVDETRLVVANFVSQCSFSCGGFVVMLYYDSFATTLRVKRFDPSTLTWSASVNVIANGDTFDACAISETDGTFALVYNVTGSPDIVVQTWDVNTMAVVDSTTHVQNDPVHVSINSNGNLIAVATHEIDGAGAKHVLAHLWSTDFVTIYYLDAPVYSNAYAVETVSVGFDAIGQSVVIWHGELVAGDDRACSQKLDAFGNTVGSRRDLPHGKVYSKPFAVNGACYALARYYALCCLDHIDDASAPWLLCGRIAWGEDFDGFLPGDQHPSPAVDGETYILPIGVQVFITEYFGGANFTAGLDLATIDFAVAQPRLWQSAVAQGCLLTAGGFAGWFDGQSVVELGFLVPPEIGSNPTVNAGGGDIEGVGPPNPHVYTYGACYEWIDERNNTHRSALSALVNVEVTAADNPASVDLVVSCLPFTRRGDPDDGALRDARIVLYRSQKNAPEILYRLTPPASAAGDPLFNDRVGTTVNHTDDVSDADLVQLGYGQLVPQDAGGPLDNEPPPGATAVCVHKNRAWLASAEDDRAVWFSKRFVAGEAPGFNVIQQIRLDDSPDGVTALASLDDKLVIFTRSRVYYVIGDGPADTGQNGSFSDPILVTSSVGCIDARSVVTFEGGVAFQGRGGIYLLTRALELVFIGAAVQETVGSSTEICSVAHDADRSWLVWLCAREVPSPLEVGVTIDVTTFVVFDYHRKVWFTWTVDSDIAQKGQAFWQGQHVWSNGLAVALESESGFDPGDTWITSTLESPWIKLNGIAGFQRVKHVVITAQRSTPHHITLDLFNDYRDVAAQTQTFDVTSGGPTLGLPVERLDCHVKYQKASAIKIQLSDAPPDIGVSTGATGCSIAGLALLAGVKEGTGKLPAPNRR